MSPQPIVRRYMPELDSLRGIAILLVVFYHGVASPMGVALSSVEQTILAVAGYGWVGVNLFFVLSGFLITGILIDSRSDEHYYRRFYVRRALRILPALWAILIVLLLVGSVNWQFTGLSVLFLANCAPLFGVVLQYGPLWSLAVEEHFYLLWPAMVRSTRWWTTILVSIFALTPLIRWASFVRAGRPEEFVNLYTWCNLDGIALGALLAVLVRKPFFDRKALGVVAGVALGVGIITMVVVLRRVDTRAALLLSTCNIASLGLLASFLWIGTGSAHRLVDRPVLKFFGFISYGLYLVHVLAFRVGDELLGQLRSMLTSWPNPASAMFLRLLVGGGVAVGIAYLSRRSLEATFLSLGRSSSGRVSGAEAGTGRGKWTEKKSPPSQT